MTENKIVCPCPMCREKDWCNIYDRDQCPAYEAWREEKNNGDRRISR